MNASAMSCRLATAAVVAVADLVQIRIARLAAAAGWAVCDVCTWPVDPAAVVAGRRPRHPGCLCGVCDAPLTGVLEPGVLHHPWCDPATGWARSGRRQRRLTVIGGGWR